MQARAVGDLDSGLLRDCVAPEPGWLQSVLQVIRALPGFWVNSTHESRELTTVRHVTSEPISALFPVDLVCSSILEPTPSSKIGVARGRRRKVER